jgi:hypothetical protein
MGEKCGRVKPTKIFPYKSCVIGVGGFNREAYLETTLDSAERNLAAAASR